MNEDTNQGQGGGAVDERARLLATYQRARVPAADERAPAPADRRSIADEIADLRRLTVTELLGRYEEVFGAPPRVKHRDWLWRKIAWRIQEHRLGGLPGAARKKLDALIADLDVPKLQARTTRVQAPCAPGREPQIGTTLVRQWHGREILATRTETGWVCDGVEHRSLSALAREITGTKWNGKLFFGLTKRKEKGA